MCSSASFARLLHRHEIHARPCCCRRRCCRRCSRSVYRCCQCHHLVFHSPFPGSSHRPPPSRELSWETRQVVIMPMSPWRWKKKRLETETDGQESQSGGMSNEKNGNHNRTITTSTAGGTRHRQRLWLVPTPPSGSVLFFFVASAHAVCATGDPPREGHSSKPKGPRDFAYMCIVMR